MPQYPELSDFRICDSSPPSESYHRGSGYRDREQHLDPPGDACGPFGVGRFREDIACRTGGKRVFRP